MAEQPIFTGLSKGGKQSVERHGMKLFKYKSLEPFEYVADIICNKRLYAAAFTELNDPMEGMFLTEPGTREGYVRDVKTGKERLRICSFSKDASSPPLWAYYADGFRGICLEVEVANRHPDYELHEVEYDDITPVFGNQAARLKHELPRLLLRRKTRQWMPENEVRILTERQFITDGIKITGILLGKRTQPALGEAIRRLVQPHVQVWATGVGPENMIVRKESGSQLQMFVGGNVN